MFVSIVVPTKNEEENVEEFFRRLQAALSGIEHEIIFVDESSDDTMKMLSGIASERKNVKVLMGSGGKGASISKGFDNSKGDVLVMIDSDLQYYPEDITKLVEIVKNFDIAVGKRESYSSIHRRVLSEGFRFVLKFFSNLRVSDTQCGLKALKKIAWEKICPIEAKGFEFDLELLSKARKAGLSIVEVPIRFSSRSKGKSKVNPLSTSIKFFMAVLRYRFL